MSFTAMLVSVGCLFGADWLHFRGPNHNGSIDTAVVPTKWGPTENILWKTPLPGRGLSGPIVVGDSAYLTASMGFRDEKLLTLAFDLKTGKLKWERQIRATGRTSCHPKMCMATPTQASDGKHIVSFYSCNDVACFDVSGNLLWCRGLNHDYPNASCTVGMSSSPVIANGVVILQVENQADSFTCGLDVATGETVWRLKRPSSTSWASPVVIETQSNGRLVVLQSGGKLSAHKPKTGEMVWELKANCHAIPSVGVSADMLLVPVMREGLFVVRKEVKSQAPEIVFKLPNAAPSTPSPIVVGNRAYTLVGPGILNCVDLLSGKILWKERFKGPFSGTPVVAGNMLIVFNEDGQGHAVRLLDKGPEILGVNSLNESILCSPAIADNAILVRSDKHLWKIGEK